MGELTAIGFTPGRSPIHRLDPRTKLGLMMMLSAASAWGGWYFLSIFSVTLAVFLRTAGLSLFRLIREIRYFLVLLLFVFAVRVVTLDDNWIPAVSPQAVEDALMVCSRLLSVVCMGVLLVATTRIADMRAALVWYLKPIPLVNEKMAATMVGLVVRFLPLIIFQAAEISDAQRARGIERRKNPFVRLMKFTIALFRRVFLSADDLVAAMQARCYSDRRTLRELGFDRRDVLALGGGVLVALTVLLP